MSALQIVLVVCKYVSVSLAGASGIFALFVEYKDKDTKRITKWGKIAVMGIVSGTFVGTLALTTETIINQKSSEANFRRYQTTLLEISRVLIPLRPQRVDLYFELPDVAICPNNDPITISWEGKFVPLKTVAGSLDIQVSLHKPRLPLEQLDTGDMLKPEKAEFSFHALGIRNENPGNIQRDSDGKSGFSVIYKVESESVYSNYQKVASLPDLPNAQLLLDVYIGNNLSGLTRESLWRLTASLSLQQLIIRFGDFQMSIPLQKVQRISFPRGGMRFVFDMPNDLASVLSLEEG